MMGHASRQIALDTLLSGYGCEKTDPREITGLSLDSREILPGHAYVAIQGGSAHGLDYAKSAIEKGATVVLVDEQDRSRAVDLLGNENVVAVRELQSSVGRVASRYYGNPSNEMNVCGVTGTDGKTSVCRFVCDSLSSLGFQTGYVGTIGWGVGEELMPNPLTTPDPITLQSMLCEMYQQGAKYVALEVSSHALVQNRVNGISFDVAVLTNLGRDHLDYHGDIAAYKEAKRSLFDFKSLRAVVVNGSDEFGMQLFDELSPESLRRYTMLEDEAEVVAKNIRVSESGIAFSLEEGDFKFEIKSPLLGDFNVENLLACFSVLRSFGFSANDACESIIKIKPVAGRMEHFRAMPEMGLPDRALTGKQGVINAVVDFSHTPQALEAALLTLRSHCQGKLTVVFGCGGDRDAGKRPQMGAVAAALADRIVITDDNPRTESSKDILEQIAAGVGDHEDVTVIGDRASAIRQALDNANADDWVLVAGKGHENCQIVGDRQLIFSDREVVSKWMGERSTSSAGTDQ